MKIQGRIRMKIHLIIAGMFMMGASFSSVQAEVGAPCGGSNPSCGWDECCSAGTCQVSGGINCLTKATKNKGNTSALKKEPSDKAEQ
jgi:hypothetical protein